MVISDKKLCKYIEDSGYKLKFIAESLHITYKGLHYKLIGIRRFTPGETLILKKMLNISNEDFMEIFNDKTVRPSRRCIESNC